MRSRPEEPLAGADLLPAHRADAPALTWAGKAAQELAEIQRLEHREVAGAAIDALLEALQYEAGMTSQLLASLGSGPGMLVGLDCRLKSPSSLARKIRTKAIEKMCTPDEAAARLNDTIRYTVVTTRPADLIPTLIKTVETLRAKGWIVREAEQSFVKGNPYKGIHLIVSGSGGHRCEIQFHTHDAFKIKQDGRVDYETYRDTDQPPDARVRAFNESVRLWVDVPTPRGLRQLEELGGVRIVSRKYPPPPDRSKVGQG